MLGSACLLGQDTQSIIQKSKEARDDNAERLKTAVATGKVEFVVHEGDSEPVQVLDADIQVFYAAPKFRIHLAYATRLTEMVRSNFQGEDFQRWVPSSLSEQVILYDGKQITAIEHRNPSQPGEEARCLGTIYFGFNKMAVMRAAGFPFEDPVTLWRLALPLENLDIRNTEITPFGQGGYIGLLTKNTYRMKFFMFSDFGYDLRRVSSYRSGESQPFRDYILHWEKSNGAYFVQSFTNVVTSASNNTGASAPSSRKLSVRYSSFDANVEIDPDAFTIASVAIPERTKFLDKRSSVEGGPKELIYRDGKLVDVFRAQEQTFSEASDSKQMQ